MAELNEKRATDEFASSAQLYATLFLCTGSSIAMTVPPTSVQVETGHQDMIVRPSSLSLSLHVNYQLRIHSRVDSPCCAA